MSEQNKLDRFIIFVKRYAKAKFLAYSLKKGKERSDASKILVNSIPKAGTNLMDSILQELPGLVPKAGRTLMEWDFTPERTINKILSTKRGFYQLAHLPAHENLLSTLNESDIKTLFIVRDPRDVIVSNFKYVLGIDVTHKSHQYIKSLNNDKERIKACILGKEDIISPLHEVYAQYAGWLGQDNCLTVKFEELVGSRGGGDDNLQKKNILSIALFLNIFLEDKKLNEILEKTKIPNTPTFRVGKVGGWTNYFDEDLLSIFDKHMADMMKRYGYN